MYKDYAICIAVCRLGAVTYLPFGIVYVGRSALSNDSVSSHVLSNSSISNCVTSYPPISKDYQTLPQSF